MTERENVKIRNTIEVVAFAARCGDAGVGKRQKTETKQPVRLKRLPAAIDRAAGNRAGK